MKRITYQLAVPVVLLVLAVIMSWQWAFLATYMSREKELHALLTILPHLPYLLFVLLVIMGWRYNNSGLVFSSFVLGAAYFVFSNHAGASADAFLPIGTAFLLPLNLLFASYQAKRRLFTPFGAIWAGLLFLQFGLVFLVSLPLQYQTSTAWLWYSDELKLFAARHFEYCQSVASFFSSRVVFNLQMIPTPLLLAYLVPFLLLGLRFWRQMEITLIGYMGALVAAFIGIWGDSSGSAPMICFSTAGIIMLITTIEASFSMAYLDDLTGLPGRRSLNELMLNLGRHYAIAMLDIDHFKKFNDTYGHKTGDDVLKMVATVFSRLRGNAKTFRYGGEEFTAVFPGKTAEEAQPYLEKIRLDIEASGFVVRSETRKKKSAANRGRESEGKKTVSVTISIGVATSSKKLDSPEKVIKAADAVLYKAKKAGRNRVMIG